MSEIWGVYAAFFGFLGLLIGLGSFLTNLTFNLEKITQRVIRQQSKQELAKKQKELDKLDKKLTRTDDETDEAVLRNLRVLHKSFSKDANNIPTNMLDIFSDIFENCIAKLEKSYEIYLTAQEMLGDAKKQLLLHRKKLIKDVEDSVLELAGTINEIRVLKLKSEDTVLENLQKKLSSQLEVAKATEESLMEFDSQLKEYQ